MQKEGATVIRYEMNIGKGGLIGTAEQGLADNGMHQFTEVTKDGVSVIYDQFHLDGISKNDYIKNIGGFIDGKNYEGVELFEKFTKLVE